MSNEPGPPLLSRVETREAATPSDLDPPGPTTPLPPYAPALAFTQAQLAVSCAISPISSEPLDLEPWIRHELAHLALNEALGGHAVPRWLQEGYAIHFAEEGAAVRAEVLTVALLRGRIADLSTLEARFPAEPQPSSI